MSWSKVKTLLIVLFAFVNAFLLYTTLKTGSSPEISQEMVSETIEILKRNNVEVDASAINRKPAVMQKAEIENSIDARANLAVKLLGNCSETEDGYVSKDGKISFSAVAFYYENFNKNHKKNISEKNAVEVATEFLNEKGFQVERAQVWDFTATEKNYEVTFRMDKDGYTVFESYIRIEILPNGILQSIEGYWPEVVLRKGSAMRVRCVSETTVLINLLSAEGFNTTVPNEVVDIRTGYTLGSLPETDSPILLTLLPAYRVILKNGESYVFDAENGEFIYKY